MSSSPTFHDRWDLNSWWVVPSVLTFVAVVALIAFNLQVTSERWLLMDLLWRGAIPVEHWFPYAFADPSARVIAAPSGRFVQMSLRALELPW